MFKSSFVQTYQLPVPRKLFFNKKANVNKFLKNLEEMRYYKGHNYSQHKKEKILTHSIKTSRKHVYKRHLENMCTKDIWKTCVQKTSLSTI